MTKKVLIFGIGGVVGWLAASMILGRRMTTADAGDAPAAVAGAVAQGVTSLRELAGDVGDLFIPSTIGGGCAGCE